MNPAGHDPKGVLIRALREIKDLKQRVAELEREKNEPIAIVGMACRFPGSADTPSRYWDLLRHGVNAVSDVPRDRWDADALYDPDPQAAGRMYTKAGGFLDDVTRFDPGFFGIAPREATTMDPQQRLLLTVSWEAIEQAGLVLEAATRMVGVFVGISTNDYAQLLMERGDFGGADGYSLTGNSPSVASGRIAYALGLQGPALSVDTACSSSLVALHLACQSLRRSECDAALAGGVNVMLSPFYHVAFCRLGALSRTGVCRTFDAAADGFVRGEGCGIVVLKRLTDAAADGDRILALVRGSAVNQDGRSSGLTVPYGPAQHEVMRRALGVAGVDGHQVSYVEAHGTGTALGDPVELQSLATVYGPGRSADRPLLVGSVKTNFGHLEAAAGVAGLMKAILALQHAEIPPQLHFREPNPRVDWKALPLRVVTSATVWPAGDSPRLAAVSAFGISGTNAHVVLQDAEAFRVEPAPRESSHQVFTLSAKSEGQLRALAGRVASFLDEPGTATVPALCHTAHTRRTHFDWRLATVVRSRDALQRALTTAASGKADTAVHLGRRLHGASPRITFMFSGQGGQLVGVGEDLHRDQPAFRDAIDRCAACARHYLDRPLPDVMFDPDRRGQPFPDLVSSHIALFALQFGLWRLWQSWGVEPELIVSQSLGEFAAAVAAEVFDAETGLMLVAERARLTAEAPGRSAMAVVMASSDRLQPALAEVAGEVWIAGHNTPDETLVAGRAHAVNDLLNRCGSAGMSVRKLRAFAEYAPHTPLMEPVMTALATRFTGLNLRRPAIEMISASTGGIVDEAIQTAEYWHAQSCRPFDMVAAVSAWLEKSPTAAVELGPGATTLGIVRRCAPQAKAAWLPSLRSGAAETAQMFASLAALYTCGTTIDWRHFHVDDVHPVVDLPLTPLQGDRYFLPDAPAKARGARPGARGESEAWLGERLVSPVAIEQFVAVVDGGTPGFLRDHRVHDRIVVAASAHLSRALAAAYRLYGHTSCAMDDLVFLQPLVLTENEPRQLALTLERDENSKARLTISSSAGAQGDLWITHVTGTLSPRPPMPPATSTDLDSARDRCREAVSVETFYAALEARGYRMGESFRRLDAIWRGDGMAVGRVRPRTDGGSFIAPGLIDAALQLLTATWPLEDLPTYVPYAVDSFRLHREPEGALWAVARLAADKVDGGAVVGDISICDAAGAPIIDIVGLRARTMARDNLDVLLGAREEAPVASRYRVEWRPTDSPSPTLIAPTLWVVFADGRVSAGLTRLLEARGDACVVVEPGSAPERIADNRWRIRPTHADDYRDVLARSVGSTTLPVRVVHLWALGEFDPASFSAAQQCGSESLLLTMQAVARLPRGEVRVRAVTANCAGPVENVASFPTHAAMWGMGPAIGREYPQLWDGLIDVSGPDADAIASALACELVNGEGSAAVALRPDARYLPQLARDEARTSQTPWLQTDATWLITGGLGFLGQQVTKWLLANGVRHIVLMGRSEPAPSAATAIQEWRHGGADVVTVRADITDRADLAAVMARIESEMPRLDGVVHLAGILDDASVGAETVEHWRRVFAPKAVGAWNLQEATAHLPLRHFILFSSAAALFGAPGQTAYCAANAALDALAAFRRRNGLPAVSINWGPWSGGGMSDLDSRVVDRWRRSGLEMLAVDDGLTQLASIISSAPDRVLVLRHGRPDAQTDRRLSSVLFAADAQPQSAPGHDRAFLASLARSADPVRRMLLLDRLRRLAAAVLGLPPTTILDDDQPLQELGMDSLMAVELRNGVVQLTGETIPVTALFDYPSLAAMADYLLGSILHLGRAPSSPSPDPTAEHLAREIDALTEEEAAERLTKALSRLGS